MPKDYIHETSVTVDHELGTCRVDTTMRGIASLLVRRGFKNVTKPNNWPSQSFTGESGQISFRKTKAARRAARKSPGFGPKTLHTAAKRGPSKKASQTKEAP